MKTILAAILAIPIGLLFIASCDSGGGGDSGIDETIITSDIDIRVDPVLQPYLENFLDAAAARDIDLNSNRLANLTLRFGILEAGTLGICSSNNSNLNDIIVSESASERSLRWIVYHELGHCILRMNHRDDFLSIMNTALFTIRLDLIGEDAAFDEFFQEEFFEEF